MGNVMVDRRRWMPFLLCLTFLSAFIRPDSARADPPDYANFSIDVAAVANGSSADASNPNSADTTQNLMCGDYLGVFRGFLSAHGGDYNLSSADAQFLWIQNTPPDLRPMGYSAYNGGNTPITTNGSHYVALLGGKIYHNLDPAGVDQNVFLSQILTFTGDAPTVTNLTPSQVDSVIVNGHPAC